MSTYAIGDVQGCFTELQRLLTLIQFDAQKDTLWFSGDLINRGSQSLETIQFVMGLGKSAITVLGNHDLHFLAVASNVEPIKRKDTFQDILASPSCEAITTWLRHRPLLHYDERLGCVITHAGLAPQWDLIEAKQCAAEVESALRSADYSKYLSHMYGNKPNKWRSTLKKWGRLRVITNYLTRMRYIDLEGRLELNYKGPVGGQPAGYYPWFTVPHRLTNRVKILFGHWASLKGQVDVPNIIALDTGCCWGNCLTAYRLEDQKVFQIDCGSQNNKSDRQE